jgi:hypothetical protein
LEITSEAALTRSAFIIHFSLVTHHPSLITFVKAPTKGSTPKKSGTRLGFQEIGIRETSRLSPETGRSQREFDFSFLTSELCSLTMITERDITVWIISALLAIGIGWSRYAKWRTRDKIVRELAAMDPDRREKMLNRMNPRLAMEMREQLMKRFRM